MRKQRNTKKSGKGAWSFRFVGIAFLLAATFGFVACSQTSPTSEPASTSPEVVRTGEVVPVQKLNLQNTKKVIPRGLRMAMISTLQKDAPKTFQLKKGALTKGVQTFLASNLPQRLTTMFHPSQTQLLSQPGEASWQFSIKLDSIGYEGQVKPVSLAQRKAAGNRMTYTYKGTKGSLSEWYVNGPLGVEQGFTLSSEPQSRPSKQALLVLKLAFATNLRAEMLPSKQGIVFRTADGKKSLYYRELFVKDAKGKTLPARMKLDGKQIILLVDDSKASYPIEIDPVFNTQTKVLSNDATEEDNFGYYSLAIDDSGDRAVVGAVYEGGTGTAYIFTRSDTTWTQEQKIFASDRALTDRFGRAVAISGEYIIVGAPDKDSTGSNSGSAYVYNYDSTSSVWVQQQILTASDAAAGDQFGFSAAIVDDTVVVGAPNDGSGSGAVYAFVRSGTTWTEQQKLTGDGGNFGEALALNTDNVAIGAPADDGTGNPGGAAYVFTRSGTTWTQEQKIQASNPSSAALAFGRSLDLDGDDLVVGIPQSGTNFTGSASVYTRSGTTWSLQQTLNASDADELDFFGTSVAIDGGFVVVGAPGEGLTGSVYTFTRSGSTWSQTQKLTPSDVSTFVGFGRAVSLGASITLVGSNGYNGADQTGAMYVFQETTNTGTCTAASLSSTPVSPQVAGTSILFSASATCSGGVIPEFKFYRQQEGQGWVLVRDWGSASYIWDTTGAFSGNYNWQVWVRKTGSTAALDAASSIMKYEITNGASYCNSVSMSTNPVSPQSALTSIDITGSATCTNSGTPEYIFYIRNPQGTTALVQDYSTSDTHNWTPSIAGDYILYVWSRAQGSTEAYQSTTFASYTITGNACNFVGLSAGPASPQTVGTSVTFTGNATCTGGAAEYQFWLRTPAGAWSTLCSYSTSTTCNWDTTGLAAGSYVIQVWSRAQGSTNPYESISSDTFVLQ